MNELRELVRKYVADEMDYAAFRRAMVVCFQSRRNAEFSVQAAVNAIGDAFVEFSDNLLSEAALKKKLTAAIAESDPLSNAIVVYGAFDESREDALSICVSSLGVSNLGNFLRNPGLNVKWSEVGQVLFAAPADRESSVVSWSVEPLHR